MSVWGQIQAQCEANAIYQTFGHQDAKPGSRHKGWFIFVHGQHGDYCTVTSSFPTFGEGYLYYEDRQDFIYNKLENKCKEEGVYRFDGEYRLSKKAKGRFVGKITRLL